MADLKKLMEKEGYKKVRTVVASGNVVFEGKKSPENAIVKKLEAAYKKHFGFEIGVIVRTMDDIRKMVKMQPFKKVQVKAGTRRYVMFLSEKPPTKKVAPSAHPAYSILKVTDTEVYSVLELSDAVKTPDVMKLIGKTYCKKMTTRNWNTVEKVAAC
jgi:uncharacterized protein (DUF1697 family)